jgi:predicted nucleotidyltransferase
MLASVLFPDEEWVLKELNIWVSMSRLSEEYKEPDKWKREMSQVRILTRRGSVVYFLPEKQNNDKGRIYADTIIDGEVTELKIILFGSHAHGTPGKNSDYDFYVVLKDGGEKPIFVLQNIYRQMCDTGYKPVDVLADYRSQFDWRSSQPTIERTISNTGVVLYDRQ